MLKVIKSLFENAINQASGSTETNSSNNRQSAIEYATATLFIELCKADFDQDPQEQRVLVELLNSTFELSETEVAALVDQAGDASREANDLYQFTLIINDHLENSEKITLVENFWRLAYADGAIDKYEEQFIRKVGGLINLPPSALVQAKLKIKQLHSA